MSENQGIKITIDEESENKGFTNALYINVPPYDTNDNRLKDVTEGLELIRVGSNEESNAIIHANPNEVFKYYISSDLFNRLEESSPIKFKKSSDIRISDVNLHNSEKFDEFGETVPGDILKLEHADVFSPNYLEKTNKPNFELNNESVLSNCSNLRTRNYKLKTQLIPNTIDCISEEQSQDNFQNIRSNSIGNNNQKEEPTSLFGNMNYWQNNTMFSPQYNTKQVKNERKDSSPISIYYNGTTEYLSQTFYDEFKKSNNEVVSKNNFIKKVAPLQDEASNINTNNNNLYISNLYDDIRPTNSFQPQHHIINNNGYRQTNNYFENVNHITNKFDPQNIYQEARRMNSNNNINEYKSNTTPIKRNNIKITTYPIGKNNTTNNIQNIPLVTDYQTTMFGKKGWICKKCNNFNYETRQNCNICGVEKINNRTLKEKVIEYTDFQSSNSDINNSSFGGHSDIPEKKKKPFVERAGDWICMKCKNLNFSFRVVCNRCQLTKSDNEKMFDYYMNNLMKSMKYNEIMQQQIIMNQFQGSQVISNQQENTTNNSVFDHNIYNPNYYNFNFHQNPFISKSLSSSANSNSSNNLSPVGFNNNINKNDINYSFQFGTTHVDHFDNNSEEEQ